jgi:heme a synthase
MAAEEHFLTRLRIVHPLLAVLASLMGWVAATRSGWGRDGATVWLPVLVGLMLITGVVNIALGVPVWMQLVHLALADALWVAYVLVSARALQPSPANASRLSPSK